MGIPETPESYQLPKDGLPEGVKFDDDALSTFRPEAHRLGITEQQFAGVLRFQAQWVAKQEQAWAAKLKQAEEASLSSLQKEFGKAFPERVAMRDDAIQKLGGKELGALLQEAGLLNHPLVFKAFATVGMDFAQDEVHGRGGASFTQGPSDAKARLAQMNSDPTIAAILKNRNHPQYSRYSAEWKKLQELASQGD